MLNERFAAGARWQYAKQVRNRDPPGRRCCWLSLMRTAQSSVIFRSDSSLILHKKRRTIGVFMDRRSKPASGADPPKHLPSQLAEMIFSPHQLPLTWSRWLWISRHISFFHSQKFWNEVPACLKPVTRDGGRFSRLLPNLAETFCCKFKSYRPDELYLKSA